VTKFSMVAPNVCGFIVWNLFHITSLVCRILRWLLDIWKIRAHLVYDRFLSTDKPFLNPSCLSERIFWNSINKLSFYTLTNRF